VGRGWGAGTPSNLVRPARSELASRSDSRPPDRHEAHGRASISRPFVVGMIPGMFSYQFELLDARGVVASEHDGLFGNDDAATDHAACVDHPHTVRVWRRGRLVANLPPLRFATEPGGCLTIGDARLLRHMMAKAATELRLDQPASAGSSPVTWRW
jgi:hypothetical protein